MNENTRSVSMPTLGLCDACGKVQAVGVCNCVMAQPISVAYCAECLRGGIECYWIMISTAAICGGVEHLADWAVNIIRRSLPVHGKTWDEFLADVAQDMQDIGPSKAEWDAAYEAADETADETQRALQLHRDRWASEKEGDGE